MLLSEMPLHHCVAALDTGFLLAYLRARVSPGSMEAAMGLNPPSSCSDTVTGMDGNAHRSCWSLCPPSAPAGVEGALCAQHPPWQLLEEWLLCKGASDPTGTSQWDPGTLCHHCLGMGQERDPPPGPPVELPATANTQTLQLTLFLCSARCYFVGEPELQTSFLLLSASLYQWVRSRYMGCSFHHPAAASLQPCVLWGDECPA